MTTNGSIQIRTWSVQRTLEPLVAEVSSLISDEPTNTKKGRSKRSDLLVENVIRATENFVQKAEEISKENSHIRNELVKNIQEVKRSGDEMAELSKIFADDPCSKTKREQMIIAARALLSSVTRLLLLADQIDIDYLLKSLSLIDKDLQSIWKSTNQEELLKFYKQYERNLHEFYRQSQHRQQDLVDRTEQEYLAAARATLKRTSNMFFIASKTYLRHPECSSAKDNRDILYQQVRDAMNTISSIIRGEFQVNEENSTGDLTKAIHEFDRFVLIKPQKFQEDVLRPQLEERLESIISGAALLADSLSTREDRRDRIVQECNGVRQALQELIDEYIQFSKKKSTEEKLNEKIQIMQNKTHDLRKQLRKAVVDHVSDAYVATSVPLTALIDAARRGNIQLVEQTANIFLEHAMKLIEVANVVCSMSDSIEGIKLVRLAAKQIEILSPQVINAARILAAHSNSKAAQENMNIFRETWDKHVQLLTEAVDEITTIEDFLAISENHILEDINSCIQATVEKNPDRIDRTAGAIRGRTDRVIDVVTAEMEKYEVGEYTETVLESVRNLRDQIIPNFVEKIHLTIEILQQKSIDERKFEIIEQELIEGSSNVYHGIRDIRNSVLMNPELEWPSDDEEGLNEEIYAPSQTSSHGQNPSSDFDMNENPSRDMMRRLPKEEREQIEIQVEGFRKTKRDFEREVLKWDDRGNDIIVLAKKMCMIMMEMTDFTRGRGPLRSTMDVIHAAKMISECGSKLNKLARDIAAQCVESQSKSDLAAYVDRITLYCHQLDITSRVKADVQNISGELIVSGLDSATSLITAAKNLMNSVVLTVKASYIASTKYRNKSGNKEPIVQWKMRLPEKKPLIPSDRHNDNDTRAKQIATKKRLEPIHLLSQFQH